MAPQATRPHLDLMAQLLQVVTQVLQVPQVKRFTDTASHRTKDPTSHLISQEATPPDMTATPSQATADNPTAVTVDSGECSIDTDTRTSSIRCCVKLHVQ